VRKLIEALSKKI